MHAPPLRDPDGLDVTVDSLDRLSVIGQDITASLEFDDIFTAVERHVGVMLDAATFYIGLVDDAFTWIDIPLFVDGSQRIPGRRIRVDDPERPGSCAVRENREILREKTLEEAERSDIPGTVPTLSALFRPLVVRERMIGVMSVQSRRAHAYGRRERLVFRALCSYVAVALANGADFRRLARLESEKLSSLAKLVAGIAHEVNTPVGTALTVASTFGRAVEDFRQRMDAGTLRRSDLAGFVDQAAEVARLVGANLTRTNDLIAQFRNVARDRTGDEIRTFRLRELLGAVTTSLGSAVQESPHTLIVDVAGDLVLTTYPEAMSRVLGNLLSNALAHAFPPGAVGTVRVEAAPDAAGRIRVAVGDDGVGIAKGDVMRIFEPFSTTRRGGRGTGLGLHIAHDLTVNVLGGRLSCLSAPGEGSTFELHLPRSIAGPAAP